MKPWKLVVARHLLVCVVGMLLSKYGWADAVTINGAASCSYSASAPGPNGTAVSAACNVNIDTNLADPLLLLPSVFQFTFTIPPLTLPCPPPSTIINGVCTAPAPPTCNPPNTIVNGVCTPPPVCSPPNSIVNGVCTPPAPPTCNPPNSIVNGVCTPPSPPPTGFAGIKTCADLGLPVPCWIELPGTAISTAASAVCPADGFGGDAYAFRTKCSSGVYAYSGSFPDYINNRLIQFGGGHADYVGNVLFAINLAANPITRTRLSNPTIPSHCWPTYPTCAGGITLPNLEELPAYPIALASRNTAGVETYSTTNWLMNFTVGTKVRLTNTGTTSMNTTVGEAQIGAGPNSGATIATISADKKTVTVIKDVPVTGAPIAPYSPQSMSTCPGGICYGAISEWSNTGPYTGAPNSRHTYNGMAYNDTLNKMVLGGGGLQGGGGTSNAFWTLDNIAAMTGDFSTNAPQWTRHFMTPTPAGKYAVQSNMPIMVHDPASHLDFYYDQFDLFAVDFAQNKTTRMTGGANLSAYHMTGVIDPNLHLFYMFGGVWSPFIRVVDIGSCINNGIAGCATNVTFQDWTAASPTCNGLSSNLVPGLAWDTPGNQVVGIPGADAANHIMGNKIYYTAVPDAANHKFTCAAVTANGSTPPQTTVNGIYGGFRYFPDADVFVLDYIGTQNVWLLRIR